MSPGTEISVSSPLLLTKCEGNLLSSKKQKKGLPEHVLAIPINTLFV